MSNLFCVFFFFFLHFSSCFLSGKITVKFRSAPNIESIDNRRVKRCP
jgi:hypothetical protein